MTRSGPADCSSVTNELSGTMSPCALRTFSVPMSSGSKRNGMSACALTWYVRPKRLKSLTYSEPRYTCIVSKMSFSATPCAIALSRSTSARTCGTLTW